MVCRQYLDRDGLDKGVQTDTNFYAQRSKGIAGDFCEQQHATDSNLDDHMIECGVRVDCRHSAKEHVVEAETFRALRGENDFPSRYSQSDDRTRCQRPIHREERASIERELDESSRSMSSGDNSIEHASQPHGLP